MSTTNIRATKRRWMLTRAWYFAATACMFILAACGGTTQAAQPSSTPSSSPARNYGLAALAGYQISLFASSTSSYSQPDSLVVDGDHVFIGYQNGAAKDGTDNKTSTIVEYTMDGKVVKTYSMPGHSDGMRIDPATKLLWVTSNEDANPKMETIDTASGTVTPYTFPPTPHGGGYDDVYFLNGMAFIAASNPTLDKNGSNPFPALDKVTLSNGKATLIPVLMGNASAQDPVAKAKVTLNEVDPDSLTSDTNGNLILINQAGSEIVTISNPGTPQQQVTRLPVGTQLDDTVWATSAKGRLLVSDGSTGLTFWIRPTHFVTGTIYTETPDDSGVAGFVGVVDSATGIISPVVIGFSKSTGMLFVPD
ncbi:MAG: hypothetical protein M3Z08_16440 [Chloroflexota bacterium]|nr:hypothetical protein [Chloroflexota bacterium]